LVGWLVYAVKVGHTGNGQKYTRSQKTGLVGGNFERTEMASCTKVVALYYVIRRQASFKTIALWVRWSQQ